MTDYNGWANRETWLVNLWFGDMFSEDIEAGETWSAEALRDYIEEYVYEQIETCSFIADMIDLGCIDWQSLEEHYKKAD